MSRYLDSIAGSLMERTAEELIVGVFLSLVLALAASGVYSLIAARRQAKDASMILTLLALVANIVGMVLVVGYVRMDTMYPGSAGQLTPLAPGPRPRANPGMIRDLTAEVAAAGLFRSADANGDGVLSASEAAEASARFVRETEAASGKPVDAEAIGSALKDRVRSVSLPPDGPGPWYGVGPGSDPGHGPGPATGPGPGRRRDGHRSDAERPAGAEIPPT